MTVGDIFWLFFKFTALQPMLRQRMLEAMRARKIAQIEGRRNSRVILVRHPPGGLVLAALQVARALGTHKAKVTVFVPHYAMSGGTLIALAADEIVMCEHSVLGPIDPQ